MSLLIAASTTVYSFLCGGILGLMDKRRDKILAQSNSSEGQSQDENKIQLECTPSYETNLLSIYSVGNIDETFQI